VALAVAGCGSRDAAVEQAKDSVRQAEAHYQRAVSGYKALIAKGKDLSRTYLELGKLYLSRGDLPQAIAAFQQTAEAEGRKWLAICYYRLGEYTDALEAFKALNAPDAECAYYYGLACEKLNLFDQALEIYRGIGRGRFAGKARQRIQAIEKGGQMPAIAKVDPQVQRLLAQAPGQAQYPQAGALIVSCREEIQITADGKEASDLYYLVKILNERGKEAFAETSIDYDSTYEKVELVFARTIRPDGKVAEVGSRNIRDVSRYMNFPLYSNARACIISFPEVADGAAIEYRVRITRNQLIADRHFVLAYSVQAAEPVLDAEFTLSLPEETPLHIKIINDKYNDFSALLSPRKEAKGKRDIYRWHFKNIPQIIPEVDMPPQAEVNPTIILSTFNSWQQIYDWWWKLAKDKVKADSAIQEKVKELMKAKPSAEEKAAAIYDFCSRQIRYVAVEYGQAGFEPHSAADIFRNKYGDCKDQAVLLVTMLKEAGLNALLALIPTRDAPALSEDFPSALFDHCIAAVALKDKTVFLDPTAETCAFGDLPLPDQGRKALLFYADGYRIEEIPVFPAQHNYLRQEVRLRSDAAEAISGEKDVRAVGSYSQAQRAWLLYTQPELIQETLNQRIQEISIGAKLDGYRIQNLGELSRPVILSYSFRGPEYFTYGGRLRIMPQLAGLDTSLVAKETRRYPIDFGVMDVRESVFEIELPPNFTVRYIPENILEDSPWMRLRAEYKRQKNKLYFTQRCELKKAAVAEEEYTDFKKFYRGAAKKFKQRVVLERLK
jgi:tetratricopeptide (TPR) repeat protein